MSVPAATVKSLCTSAEIELVRASRKPQLDALSPVEVKRLADRARKLHDKWRDVKRDQARSKSRVAGVGKPGDNTKLKAQIFGEAREALENRLQKLAAKDGGAKSGSKAAAKSAPASKAVKTKSKTKAQRNVDHRNRRSAVREGLAVTKDILNEPPRLSPAAKAAAIKAAAAKPAAAKKPAAKSAAEKPAVAPPVALTSEVAASPEGQTAAPVAKPRRAKKPAVTKLHAPKGERINAAQQLEAVTAAKHSRIVRSGVTTRGLGHTQARGQRKQARRDSR
jgi:hypothetical protein